MFKPKLSFKKKTFLGLDLGSNLIKAVRLSYKEGDKSHLDFCGVLDISGSKESFVEPLKKFITENRLDSAQSCVCIDDSSLKIRKLELPKMPEADLKEAVKWKMRDVVEGPIEEFIVRSSSVTPESDNAKQVDLVGYAIRKETVKKVLSELEKAGIKIDLVEPSVVSLAAAVEPIYPSDNEWVATLDLGATKSLMIITGHTRFYFSRPLSGIKIPKTDEEKASFNQRLAAEIQNTIDTFSITFHVDKINRILLSGGGAQIPGLCDYLSKNLAIPTDILNAFKNIEIESGQEETVNKDACVFSQALSLAQVSL